MFLKNVSRICEKKYEEDKDRSRKVSIVTKKRKKKAH